MKDFFPTFTFGFLMAQLFPGGATVLFLTCPYLTYSAATGSVVVQTAFPALTTLFASIGDVWFLSTRNAVVFLFLAAATGMFLHGLDWMILGWETTECDAQGKPLFDNKGNPQSQSLRELRFHRGPIWRQVVLGPFNMVFEIIHLFRAPQMKCITIDDNAAEITPASLPLFNWLQDFYLYFGQFYIHMAYALLFGLASFAATFFMMGFTPLRFAFLVVLYLLTGLLFLMGRTQLASLFRNENILVEASKPSKAEPIELIVTNRP